MKEKGTDESLSSRKVRRLGLHEFFPQIDHTQCLAESFHAAVQFSLAA